VAAGAKFQIQTLCPDAFNQQASIQVIILNLMIEDSIRNSETH